MTNPKMEFSMLYLALQHDDVVNRISLMHTRHARTRPFLPPNRPQFRPNYVGLK